MGKLFGSINNRLMENCTGQPVPVVGLGATECCWTDRHAYTISRVAANGKRFWMKADKATRSDKLGMSDAQSYTYEPQPDAPEREVRRQRDGSWKIVKGNRVMVGHRDEHYDFSF